jgi:hypothetical protein
MEGRVALPEMGSAPLALKAHVLRVTPNVGDK